MKLLAHLALLAVLWLITAWFLMLGVDIANDDWLPVLPSIGFETSLALATLWLIRNIVAGVMSAIQKADAR
jgi:hypothetical protein